MNEITLNQNSLRDLVKKFEENEYELTDVPQDQVEQFGYGCLSHALLFKKPHIPKYDLSIPDYIKSHTFNSINSLVSYISTLNDDINKLFAIFSYEALNFEYDADHKKSNVIEEIFKTKKANSEEYTLFFLEISKLIQISHEKIQMQKYIAFSKGYDYDPLTLPQEINPNHTSICIQIEHNTFISDPTLASCEMNDNTEKIEKPFNSNLFLIPLYDSICNYYPLNDCQKVLPFKYPFGDFYECIKIFSFEKKLKIETYPFVKITASNGYIAQTYSCISPIKHVDYRIYKKEAQAYKEIASIDGISSYEVIEKKNKNHKERCRFISYIIFQKVGFYQVEMFIDSFKILNYYVNVLQKNEGSIPVTMNYFHEQKFIPMRPQMVLSNIVDGRTIIRFAVATKNSDILWDIVKLNDQNGFNVEGEIINRKLGRYIKLTIPFDDERYEDQLCVTFPSNGRYAVSIYLSNDEGSFSNYIKYYFDVTGAESNSPKPINPVYYMFGGRKFAPKQIFDKDKSEVVMKPNLNCYLVKEKDQTIQIKTKSKNDRIYLEFKQEDKTVAFPSECDGNGEFRRFKWSIPGEYGEYHLIGWINEKQCFDLTYIYHNLLFKENSQDENELLDELMQKIQQEDPAGFEAKKERARKLNEIKDDDDEIVEIKQSSKCCLLI